MSARILALSVLAIVVSSGLARAQVIGPIPYTSTGNSPFTPASFQGYFHREDCEDGFFNVPGVTPSQGVVFGPSSSTDSVDADDGSIDGSGLMGRSFLVFGSGNPACAFTFHANLLGSYPTHVGIVLTDAYNPAFAEAFSSNGTSLGVVTVDTFGSPSAPQGQTGEDRFVGYIHGAGIGVLRVWTTGGGGLEVDHLQYGLLNAPAGTSFCPGDGTGTACPCGNSGGVASGCANSVNPAGASLSCSGIASVSADTLRLIATGMPNSSALFFQGTTQANGGAGVVFGDGKRCVTGTVIRFGTTMNVNGMSHYPAAGQAPVSTQGVPGPGGTRHYQVSYRNAANFCGPATHNQSNGQQVTWGQ